MFYKDLHSANPLWPTNPVPEKLHYQNQNSQTKHMNSTLYYLPSGGLLTLWYCFWICFQYVFLLSKIYRKSGWWKLINPTRILRILLLKTVTQGVPSSKRCASIAASPDSWSLLSTQRRGQKKAPFYWVGVGWFGGSGWGIIWNTYRSPWWHCRRKMGTIPWILGTFCF